MRAILHSWILSPFYRWLFNRWHTTLILYLNLIIIHYATTLMIMTISYLLLRWLRMIWTFTYHTMFNHTFLIRWFPLRIILIVLSLTMFHFEFRFRFLFLFLLIIIIIKHNFLFLLNLKVTSTALKCFDLFLLLKCRLANVIRVYFKILLF
jgi:hypothetical protein